MMIITRKKITLAIKQNEIIEICEQGKNETYLTPVPVATERVPISQTNFL